MSIPTADGFAALVAKGELAQNAETLKIPKGASNALDKYGEGYWMEPKMDGWRIIARVGEDSVDFYSRSGKSYNGTLPKVEAELLANFPAGTWLDGEAVAIRLTDDGKVINEWSIAQSVMTKVGGHAAADRVSYVVFDLLAHRNIDARQLPLAKRRGLLEAIFADFDGDHSVTLVPTHGSALHTHEAFLTMGYEGTIIKRANAPYASNKREGAGWTKVKPQTTIEAVVTGFKPGENGFKGMVGALIFGQHDEDGNMVERGRCSGMDMRTRQDMTKNPDKWLGTVIEVAHMGAMKDGLRHPQFKRRRPDRSPESVVIHDA